MRLAPRAGTSASPTQVREVLGSLAVPVDVLEAQVPARARVVAA